MPWHWPGYNYLGPGTNRFDRPAKNRLDAAARRHDKRYYRYGKKAYFYYNKADDEFVKTAEKIPGIASAVSRGVFKLKKMIAPSLPEKEMARSRSRGRSRTPKRIRMNTPPTSSRQRSASRAPTSRSGSAAGSGSAARSMSVSARSSASRRSVSTTSVASSSGSSGSGALGKIKTYKQKSGGKHSGGNLWYNKNGVVLKQESGGQLSDSQAVYLGHSTIPTNVFMQNVFIALAKKVFLRLGYDVSNLGAGEAWGSNNELVYDFTYRNNPATGTAAFTAGTLRTYNGLRTVRAFGEDMLTYIKGELLSKAQVEFGAMRFYRSFGTPTTYLPWFEIDLRQLKFAMHLTSIMKAQNTTLANTDGTDPNRDTVDDVEANPLIGYLYKKNKWANYLELKGISGVDPVPLVTADSTIGQFQIQGSLVTGEDTNVFLKPPTKAYQVGCSQQANVKVAPGRIVTSRLDFKVKRIGFNQLMKIMMRILTTSSTSQVEIGNCAMFGLEKVIQAFQVNTAPVKLQYQIDLIHRIAAIQGRNTFTADSVKVIGV